jgi:hypothetical protein
MGRVIVSARDSQGNISPQTYADYSVVNPTKLVVAGGIYLGGNGDVRPKTIDRTPPTNIKGLQQYHSFADGMVYPGYQRAWVGTMVDSGVWLNLVMELKHYGAPNVIQTFTVEGKAYRVPMPDGTIQRRPGMVFPLAYSYDQVTTGAIDGLIHRLMAQLRGITGNKRVNIQLASEVDTDNEFGVSIGASIYTREQADIKAVAAYQYIVNFMRNPPNGIAPVPSGVTVSLGYAGQWSGIPGFLRTHPESLMAQLDYMHMNSYNHSANWTAEARFREIVTWTRQLGPIGRSKNIIVSEFGSSAAFPTGQAGYMGQVPAALTKLNAEQVARNEGRFVMAVWFGSRDSSWGTLSPEEEGLAALQKMLDTSPFK